MDLTLPIVLLVAHFIGDFLLQSNKMALNKSKDNEWLAVHAFVYSCCFLPWGVSFFIITFFLHFCVDYVTSRITSRLWFVELMKTTVWEAKEPFTYDDKGQPLAPTWKTWPYAAIIHDKKRHWFFVAVGFDQLLHFVCLAFTYRLLVG